MSSVSLSSQKRPSFAEFNGGKEPTSFLFEDEQCVVFDEPRNKQAPEHFLVVPKKTMPSLIETSDDDELLLGHMLLVAKNIAIERGLDRTGYHVMVDEEHQVKLLGLFMSSEGRCIICCGLLGQDVDCRRNYYIST